MTSASNILIFKGDENALSQQVINAGDLVVVYMYASWCPSCKKLSAQLPQIANDYPNVLFLKTNVDEAKSLCSSFSITSIPHLKFFKINENQKLQELCSVTGANIPAIREKLSEFANTL